MNLIDAAIEAGMKEKNVSLKARVSLEAGNGGKTSIAVNIANAATSQETFMFIPVTPKSVHGLAAYRDFLSRFEGELKRIDPRAKVRRR